MTDWLKVMVGGHPRWLKECQLCAFSAVLFCQWMMDGLNGCRRVPGTSFHLRAKLLLGRNPRGREDEQPVSGAG